MAIGIAYHPDLAGELAVVKATTFTEHFNAAREASSLIGAMTSDYVFDGVESDTIHRLSYDGRSGYVVRHDGELTNVFSLEPGRGAFMMSKAVERDGATRLDCFDGYLVDFYSRHGFVESHREPNWTAGEPDVVFMVQF